ncbi:MAG UNVERIFIED_CONTAM: hypothetical protein LVR29_17080, partial [Microcystis novacekii LVE1205-3]
MNSARLHVGLQGLGRQEMATQNALRYALEHVQGRAALPLRPAQPTPIALHPAVRHAPCACSDDRGAARGGLRRALALDEAAHHEDRPCASAARPGRVARAVVKACCTHHGFQGAERGAAGLRRPTGYIADYSASSRQPVRDARTVRMVYEGADKIQAVDLLQRQVAGRRRRRACAQSLHEALEEAARCQDGAAPSRVAAQALRAQCECAPRPPRGPPPAAAADREARCARADDCPDGPRRTPSSPSGLRRERAPARRRTPTRDWAHAERRRACAPACSGCCRRRQVRWAQGETGA